MTQPATSPVGPPYGRPAEPSSLPLEPVSYPEMLRTPRGSRLRGLLMIVSFVVAYLLVSTLLQGAAIAFDIAQGRTTVANVLQVHLTLTPALLLAVNLSNAASIVLSMALQRAFFGQGGRWLHSVVGRLRWGVLLRASLIALPFWAAYLAIGLASEPGSVRTPTGTYLVLLVIVVLTTPLQAAGEEYGARGLINRGAGTWTRSPRAAVLLGTLLSAGVFTVAHGAGDPWLIGFYFVFGVLQCLVTWRSGGLEIAVVQHTANNLVAFGTLVLLQQDTSKVLDRSAGSAGPAALLPLAVLLLSTGTLWAWVSRSRRIQRRYEPDPAAARLAVGPLPPRGVPSLAVPAPTPTRPGEPAAPDASSEIA